MSMCVCDYDGPELFTRIERKARKIHKCYECRKEIKPGDEYSCHKGLWDGQWDEFKICEACQDLSDSMQEAGFCTGYGNLLSDHAEYIAYYAPPKLTT